MNLWGFISAAVLLTLMPGPDILFVITQSITRGRKAGMVFAAGLCTGLIAHFLGSPVLYYDYRYPIRNATFQISRTGTHSFRTRCKIKPFILQTIC